MNQRKQDNKSILKNSLYNIIYRIMNIIFPIVIIAYVGRVLLPDGVGKVSYAQNIVTYFTFIAALGLPIYGTREISRRRNNSKERNKVFTELFIMNALSTFCCVIAYYFLVTWIPFFANWRMLYYVAGISIILNFLNVDWLYQGLEEYKYIALRGIIIKALSLVCIFVFVRSHDDYIVYALIQCFVLAGNYILNIIGLRRRVRFDFDKISLKYHLKPLLVFFASSISIELYTLFDTTMLGIWGNDTIVGYFTYAMKTSKIIITLLTASAAVLLPRLSLYQHEGNERALTDLVNKCSNVLLYFAIPCTVGLVAIAPEIMQVLYGESFIPAVPTLRILSLLTIPVTFSTFYGGQVLCAINQEKKVLMAVIVGAASNLIMNYFLIPAFMEKGAAVASFLSELLVVIIDYVMIRKNIEVKIPLRDVISSVIAAIVMGIVVYLLRIIGMPPFVYLVIACGVGFVLYLLISYILGNSLIRKDAIQVINRIRVTKQ